MSAWYVVQTHPVAEAKAHYHLSNQGYEAFLPQYRKTRRHARRVDVVYRPLFPSYLFVRLDLEQDRWSPINATVGVRRIVSANHYPIPVPDGICEELISRSDDAGVVELKTHNLTKGEHIALDCGPFSGVDGIFESMVDEERVIVLLNIMGREVRTQVRTADLETGFLA